MEEDVEGGSFSPVVYGDAVEEAGSAAAAAPALSFASLTSALQVPPHVREDVVRGMADTLAAGLTVTEPDAMPVAASAVAMCAPWIVPFLPPHLPLDIRVNDLVRTIGQDLQEIWTRADAEAVSSLDDAERVAATNAGASGAELAKLYRTQPGHSPYLLSFADLPMDVWFGTPTDAVTRLLTHQAGAHATIAAASTLLPAADEAALRLREAGDAFARLKVAAHERERGEDATDAGAAENASVLRLEEEYALRVDAVASMLEGPMVGLGGMPHVAGVLPATSIFTGFKPMSNSRVSHGTPSSAQSHHKRPRDMKQVELADVQAAKRLAVDAGNGAPVTPARPAAPSASTTSTPAAPTPSSMPAPSFMTPAPARASVGVAATAAPTSTPASTPAAATPGSVQAATSLEELLARATMLSDADRRVVQAFAADPSAQPADPSAPVVTLALWSEPSTDASTGAPVTYVHRVRLDYTKRTWHHVLGKKKGHAA